MKRLSANSYGDNEDDEDETERQYEHKRPLKSKPRSLLLNSGYEKNLNNDSESDDLNKNQDHYCDFDSLINVPTSIPAFSNARKLTRTCGTNTNNHTNCLTSAIHLQENYPNKLFHMSRDSNIKESVGEADVMISSKKFNHDSKCSGNDASDTEFQISYVSQPDCDFKFSEPWSADDMNTNDSIIKSVLINSLKSSGNLDVLTQQTCASEKTVQKQLLSTDADGDNHKSKMNIEDESIAITNSASFESDAEMRTNSGSENNSNLNSKWSKIIQCSSCASTNVREILVRCSDNNDNNTDDETRNQDRIPSNVLRNAFQGKRKKIIYGISGDYVINGKLLDSEEEEEGEIRESAFGRDFKIETVTEPKKKLLKPTIEVESCSEIHTSSTLDCFATTNIDKGPKDQNVPALVWQLGDIAKPLTPSCKFHFNSVSTSKYFSLPAYSSLNSPSTSWLNYSPSVLQDCLKSSSPSNRSCSNSTSYENSNATDTTEAICSVSPHAEKALSATIIPEVEFPIPEPDSPMGKRIFRPEAIENQLVDVTAMDEDFSYSTHHFHEHESIDDTKHFVYTENLNTSCANQNCDSLIGNSIESALSVNICMPEVVPHEDLISHSVVNQDSDLVASNSSDSHGFDNNEAPTPMSIPTPTLSLPLSEPQLISFQRQSTADAVPMSFSNFCGLTYDFGNHTQQHAIEAPQTCSFGSSSSGSFGFAIPNQCGMQLGVPLPLPSLFQFQGKLDTNITGGGGRQSPNTSAFWIASHNTPSTPFPNLFQFQNCPTNVSRPIRKAVRRVKR